MKPMLTVIINTKNSERTLERALQSVAAVDEIVVVDMASTDKTESLARKYTKKVYSYEDIGYVEPARNFAIAKATTEWVFILDSDEEVTPPLLEKLKELIEHKSDIVCYFIPRKNIIFGKWIQKTGWWPDFQPRLFKKECVTWQDEVHSVPQIVGSVEYLPADPESAIIHHNYESVSDYLQRMDRYTAIAAEERKSEHDFSSSQLINSFSNELSRRLFYEKGIEEGLHGVGLSFLQSMYEFVTYLKIWEKSDQKEKEHGLNSTVRALNSMRSTLAYWLADYQVSYSSGLKNIYWRVRRKLQI